MMPDIGSTPQFEVSTLAMIHRQILERPPYMAREPLALDRDTYEKAIEEMASVMNLQGRRLSKADWLKMDNFLLYGVPVVMNDL